MDKFKAWIEDPKNAPKVAAVFGVVLLLAAFVVLKSMGVIGGGGGAAMTPDMGATPPEQTAPGPSGPAPATPPPAAPAPAGPAGPTDAAATAQTPAPGAAASTDGPMLPYRKDPFVPFAGRPTKKDVISLIIPTLRRPRIAPAPVTEMQDEQEAADALPPQPFRRMAGVLWNGRVSAILETNGETDIVRPGMEINRGGSRALVESITQDSIILKTLDTKTPQTVVVGMAGSVTGNSATGATTPGGGPDMMQNGPY